MSDRLDDLEQRLSALEARFAEDSPNATASGRFWALDTISALSEGTRGAVVFAGRWREDQETEGIGWQYGLGVDAILDRDWDSAATRLTALGHPVRLMLLRHILTGTTATRDLAATEGLGTTGQLHHHLRALVSAGWLRQHQRGDYEIPGERVIPLLTILAAALD